MSDQSERDLLRDLEVIAEEFKRRADEARKRSNDARFEESSVFWAGKCLALADCAEHLAWFLSTREKP